ncbi:hypothetical protein DL93DRAFT_2077420 [Clavulina sp. PMI_390]|nr:hypothetical protein DL93DRAFT_2077420 [Clavulina sp. PMI_390]
MCLEELSGHESNVSGIALHKWANVKAARFIPGVALPLFHAARLPNLRSLYLLAHWEENSDIISHLASWGDTLTSLEIRLGDIPFPLPSGSPNFPNLEHLHADTLMLATLILKNSERLESLALSLDAEEPSDALQHITHFHTLARWRQLRTLHFVDCNFTNVNVLPPWSALCSLKELEFSGCKEMPKVLKELEQSFHEDCTRNGWAENPELISSKQTGSFPCLERLKMLVPAKGKAWLPELIETHVRQLHTWRPLLIIQLQFDSNA